MNEREKTFIALGAAMGAGCRKCAEGLQEKGQTMKMAPKDIWRACEIGLNAKAEAVNTMRAAVSSFLNKTATKETECGCDKTGDAGTRKMACLIRLASFAASNSSPDALSEIEEADSAGADGQEINLCLSIAKMVREKAAGYAGQEIGKKSGGHESGKQETHDREAGDEADTGCSCGCRQQGGR